MARRKRWAFNQELAIIRRQNLIFVLTEEAAIAGRVQAQVGEEMVERLEGLIKGAPPWERLQFWRRVERLVEDKINVIVEDGLDLLQEISSGV